MDRLISENSVLNVINRYGTDELRRTAVQALPSAFHGMTNGDVMKNRFPNGNEVFGRKKVYYSFYPLGRMEFTIEWWNSPYEEG